MLMLKFNHDISVAFKKAGALGLGSADQSKSLLVVLQTFDLHGAGALKISIPRACGAC
jgi:hypothetical protein